MSCIYPHDPWIDIALSWLFVLLFDTTIFAWGRWTALTLEPMEIKEIYRFFNTTSKNHVYLLANSPASFDKPFNGRTLRFSPNATISLQPYLPWQWKPEHVRRVCRSESKCSDKYARTNQRIARKEPKVLSDDWSSPAFKQPAMA